MNILQTRTEAFITPTKPKALSEDRIYVYVPQATSTNAGIASYDSDDFIVTKGDVSLNRELRDAYVRPELVMLNRDYFPVISKVSDDGKYYNEYSTSAVHYNIIQNLTNEQKERARSNIDAVGIVLFQTELNNRYTKDKTYSKAEIDNKLTGYYTKANTYNKTEVDNKLSDYYTKDETYNKVEIDNKLLEYYINYYTKDETYSKTEVDNKLLDYYTKDETYSKTELYNKTEINDLISVIPKFDIKVVTELPTTNISINTIYLLVKDETEPDLYDEYIYIDNKWELLGSQQIEYSVTADSVLSVIEDSDTIVSMTTDNDKIKFELAANLTNRLNKALITPMSAPNAIELVAIDTENSQTMIGIGDGLVYENGMLRAIPQSSGDEGVVVQDTLASQDAAAALSARQGNVLYNMIVDTNAATNSAINETELNAQKYVLIGGDGVLEGNVYNFAIDNPEAYIGYKTNLTRFLIDLNLPIVGEIDTAKEVTITFGDTSYYVHNILKGMEHVTIGDLQQVEKYSNATGYRFITEMTFFETNDMVGFAIIPTISMSDVLSLDSDQMDDYLTNGGLIQGQLAICKKVVTNGYAEGAIYRFDITYPDTYAWTLLKGEIDTELNINSENSVQNKVITAALNNRYTKSEVDGLIAGLGTVFDLKGTKNTVGELPNSGNTIGDVWYVVQEQVAYIWLNDGTTNKWEQFGAPVDLSGYIPKADIVDVLTSTATNKVLSAYQGKVLNDRITAVSATLAQKANNSALDDYLPLSAGSGKSLTDSLYMNNNKFLYGKTTANATRRIIGIFSSNDIIINPDNSGKTMTGGSAVSPLAAGNKSVNLGVRNTNEWNNVYAVKYYQNGKEVANAEDIPEFSLQGSTLTITI